MPQIQPGVGRRAVLRGSVASCTFASIAPVAGEAADLPVTAPLGAPDVQRIAAVLYGVDLPAGDAVRIAATAAGVLASLHYLTLLRSDDVQLAFGYPAMVAEASRGLVEP
jgi:hypothetical protein